MITKEHTKGYSLNIEEVLRTCLMSLKNAATKALLLASLPVILSWLQKFTTLKSFNDPGVLSSPFPKQLSYC